MKEGKASGCDAADCCGDGPGPFDDNDDGEDDYFEDCS
jgi:hypothetical protein